MAIITQSVPVAGEVVALMSVVQTVVVDVKGGKAVSGVVLDAVPALVAALTGVGDLKGELANPEAIANGVLLSVEALIKALKS